MKYEHVGQNILLTGTATEVLLMNMGLADLAAATIGARALGLSVEVDPDRVANLQKTVMSALGRRPGAEPHERQIELTTDELRMICNGLVSAAGTTTRTANALRQLDLRMAASLEERTGNFQALETSLRGAHLQEPTTPDSGERWRKWIRCLVRFPRRSRRAAAGQVSS